MHRRTALRLLAATLTFIRVGRVQAWSQTLTFPARQDSAFQLLGALVLPESLGKAGTAHFLQDFENWVRDYRSGADTDHGYGHTHVTPLPQSPAPLYLQQLSALENVLLRGTREQGRAALEEQLNAAGVKELTPHPAGKHLAADLMSFYFHSSQAANICYGAAINRYDCRGLAHSSEPPPKLRETTG